MSEAAPEVRLRPATRDDLELLRHWDRQPHVMAAAGRDDRHWDTELGRDVPWREYLIAEVDGRPVAFLELLNPHGDPEGYWGEVPGDVRAMDIWIGEATDLGRGFGTRIMGRALDRLFQDPGVTAVLLDPRADNVRAHRFHEWLGFRFVERRRFGEDDCFVYRLARDEWQANRPTAPGSG